MKVFVFGTGLYYQYYRKWLLQLDVIALLDNNPEMQGREKDGYQILAPREVNKYTYDRIYILSTFINEIREQLISLNVPEEKIYAYFELLNKNFKTQLHVYYPEKTLSELMNRKKIIMISPDLSLTGAPNCLFETAKLLIKNNCMVLIASPYDGKIREQFLSIGVTVIIDERLAGMGYMKELDWVKAGDILLVNTVFMYYLMIDRDMEIPAIWWLHEPEILYKRVIQKMLLQIKGNNLKIYTVSRAAENALHKFWPDVSSEDFLYGIPDSGLQNKYTQKHHIKMKFVVVGYISKLKGHDILIEAISKLSEEEKENSEFCFIGKITSGFGEQIINKIHKLKLPVTLYGEMEHQKVLNELDSADVLICASRTESMSLAVTEALMKSVLVIVSNAAGIVRYIEDGKNGFIFQSEDVEELTEKISLCISRKACLEQAAMEGRRTYLKNFSLDAFENRIKKIFKI